MVERYRGTKASSTKPLANQKHERFAQGVASGMTDGDAYLDAGYTWNSANCSRLKKDDRIKARVHHLLMNGAKRAEISVEKIVREYARIAFADIRKILKWRSNVTVAGEDPETGEEVLRAFHEAEVVDSNLIDDDVAAAISEVIIKDGTVRVKMHNKIAALSDLAKHLQMFKEIHEHTGKGGGPVQVANIDPRALEGLDTKELMVLEKVFGQLVDGRVQAPSKEAKPEEYAETLH